MTASPQRFVVGGNEVKDRGNFESPIKSSVINFPFFLDLNNPIAKTCKLIAWEFWCDDSNTGVRFEVWRRLPNNMIKQIYGDGYSFSSTSAGLNRRGLPSIPVEAGDVIGLRCVGRIPVSYSINIPGSPDNLRNDSTGKVLFQDVNSEPFCQVMSTCGDGPAIPIAQFRGSYDRTYSLRVWSESYESAPVVQPPTASPTTCPSAPATPIKTGKLLVLHDEWTLSDTGFQQAPDTPAFVQNIAKYFAGTAPAKFLVYSTNPHLLGAGLERAFTNAGHTWVKGRSTPLDPATLAQYKGIFVGSEPTDNQLLIDYIKKGGNVCLIAGTGYGNSQSEAAQWSQLLSAFGLRLDTSYNNINAVLPVTTPNHPLFAGVKALYQNLGQTVHLLPDSKASMIMIAGNQGLIALSEFPVTSSTSQPTNASASATPSQGSSSIPAPSASIVSPGVLLVLGDDWYFKNEAFDNAPSTSTFLLNIAKAFAGGSSKAKLCILDPSPHYYGNKFYETLANAGHTCVNGAPGFEKLISEGYKGIFVNSPDFADPIPSYIISGGNVCIIAAGWSVDEGWNKVLKQFGLRFEASSVNNIAGAVPVSNPNHPLLAGVSTLYQMNGTSISLLPGSRARVLLSAGGHNLVAVANA